MENLINSVNDILNKLKTGSLEYYDDLKNILLNNINENLIIFYQNFAADNQLIITECLNKNYINLNVITPIEYCYSFSLEEKSNLALEIKKNLVLFKIFVKILKSNINLENFVLNSICDYLGKCMKLFVVDDDDKNYINMINNEFFINKNNDNFLFIGIKILYYTFSNFLINIQEYGYFRFRRLCYSFNENYLILIFDIIYKITNKLLMKISSNEILNNSIFNLLVISLETFFKCIIFPFNISYYDFNLGNTLDEITIIVFPDEFKLCFNDGFFIQNLFNLVIYENQNLNENLKFNIRFNAFKILNRISGTRLNLFDRDEEMFFKSKMIVNLRKLVQSCFYNNKIYDNWIIEYLELNMKIVFIFNLKFISEHKDLKNEFIYQLEEFSTLLFKNISFSVFYF